MYERQVEGQVLAFAPDATWTTVRDTTTGSVWNIVTGEAMAGPLKGKRLTRVPHHNICWFAWADFYPETTVFEPERQSDAP